MGISHGYHASFFVTVPGVNEFAAMGGISSVSSIGPLG